MPRILKLVLVGTMLLIAVGGCAQEEQETITVFCGSVSKPAVEEAAQAFTETTGIKVYLNFSGSGIMLSQMKISKSGDLYMPASPDYMLKAERDGVVEPESVRIISYLVPAILVQAGNPRDIQTLSDLAGPGIEVAIGNPEVVSIGRYAVEILAHNDLIAEVEPNIVTHAENVAKLISLIALKSVDAALGWRVGAGWNDTIDVVYLEPEQIPRLSYIQGAISTFAENREGAQKFLDFLVSPRGQEIFSKWGYITTESEAKKFAPNAEIGGEYKLPEEI